MYCVRRLVTGLVILGGCCLGGCATPLAVTNVTDIKSSTGSRGIDVYEPKRRADGKQSCLSKFAALPGTRRFVKFGAGRMPVARYFRLISEVGHTWTNSG